MNRSTSAKLAARAQRILPGGVNSPGRAFLSVGAEPVFIEKAEGPYLIDVDQNRYIDYVGSMGPNILGNSHPAVVAAVSSAARNGLTYWLSNPKEVELAELISQLMPSLEMLRLVSSGTEATMSAIRLARAATKRNKILKFEGCYHGHDDAMLVKSGSGTLDIGVPSSPGVPDDYASHTLNATYNDLDSVRRLFDHHGSDIAAVILEPIAGNMGCVPPKGDFLTGLRTICDEYQSLLIVDEVMTGFRVGLGGATEKYNLKPDLITIGKVIGGGLPVGAFGGRKELMSQIAPAGPVYHAGTLSGNPISVAAGIATLNVLTKPGFFDRINYVSDTIAQGFRTLAAEAEIPVVVNQVGGMFSIYFTEQPAVTNFDQVMQCDQERYKIFFNAMLDNGVFLAPSPFECHFPSYAHTDSEIDLTLKAAKAAFQAILTTTN